MPAILSQHSAQNYLAMDMENATTSSDAVVQGLSLTLKAEHAAEKLHMGEAEVSQHVAGTVEV